MKNIDKTHCPQGHEYTEENTALRPRPNGKFARDCRKCCSARNARASKRMKLKRKSKYYRILSNSKCVDCGESRIACLQYDHKDPSTKLFTIADGVHDNVAWSKVVDEIAKCEVRCANCHAVRTAEQFGWYKNYDMEQK